MSSIKDKLGKYSVDDLKDVAAFLNLERGGDKSHLIDRISDYLLKPQDLGASKASAPKKSSTKKATKKASTPKKLTGKKRKAPAPKKAPSKPRRGSKHEDTKMGEEHVEDSAPMEIEEKSEN